MYTQCSECLTVYKLVAETVAKSSGLLRCGDCNATFDALKTLTEQLPPEPFTQLPVHASEATPPQLDIPALRPLSQPHIVFKPDQNLKPTYAPTFIKFPSRNQPSLGWPWKLGVSFLLLSLGGQLLYAERGWWQNAAELRPWLDQVCTKLHCRLPLRKDAAQLELLSRDIRPHPSVEHALIISATLHNAAAFAQAFPKVEVTLSDLDENRVAMRRFQAREYVADPKTLTQGIAPGATTALVFEVEDPSKDAVAFEFKFF